MVFEVCDGSEDQKWAEEEGREDGTIVHPATGMCLESGEKFIHDKILITFINPKNG